MLLIGAGHKAKQGKSEFCNTIMEQCDRTGISCALFSISDLILSYAAENGILPKITREECTDEQVNELVRLGIEKRQENPDFWLDQVKAAIAASSAKVGLIPNVRCVNEAEFIKSIGGYLVKVQRLNLNGTRYVCCTRDSNSIMESALDTWNWDFVVSAKSGQKYWLRRQAVSLFDYLRDGAEGEASRI